MDEAGGATSLWTFEADGTFFATSSLQALLHFSDQQGSWEKHGNAGLKGVVLALVFDDNYELLNVSRVDVSLHTVGNGCDNIAGSLEVREFTGAEDPLDPATDTGDPIAWLEKNRPWQRRSPALPKRSPAWLKISSAWLSVSSPWHGSGSTFLKFFPAWLNFLCACLDFLHRWQASALALMKFTRALPGKTWGKLKFSLAWLNFCRAW